MSRPQFILTINAGSSSLKFALFQTGKEPARQLAGKFERIGLESGKLSVSDFLTENRTERTLDVPNHIACVGPLENLLKSKANMETVRAVGHRIVHGGPRYTKPEKVNTELLEQLRRIRFFDPDHLPAELALVKHFAERYPRVPQIACFDTAFHRSLPRVARILPIPRRYQKEGVQRYGFHGLSYGYLMEQLKKTGGSAA